MKTIRDVKELLDPELYVRLVNQIQAKRQAEARKETKSKKESGGTHK